MSGSRGRVSINHGFYSTLKPVLRIWLEKTFNLKADIPGELKELSPPYLILPNHQGFWDPFMAGIYIPHKINYIASDAVFRSPFFRILMNLLGAIPKTKAQSDIDALKNIIAVKERGGVIGIFPEGRRTWDGATLPIVYSTSKLIRMLGIPVVTVVFKGGYYSQPRWGFHIQKGEIVMDYRILFHGNEVKKMRVDEIHSQLSKALSFDEVEYYSRRSVSFIGKRPAEYLERVLFTCPECGNIGSIYSSDDRLECRDCGYEVMYNTFRRFESSRNEVIFDTIRGWNLWQQKSLEKYLDSEDSSDKVLLVDDNLVFHTGYRSRKPRFFTKGSLLLVGENLVIKDTSEETVESFPLQQITGLNIQNKEILEFYHRGILYTIRGKSKRFSAYKWLKASEYLLKDKMVQFHV